MPIVPFPFPPPASSPFSRPHTPLQATSSHLRRTHTSLKTPVASLLLPHLADTMLRCRAPPLEAVDHLRCPLYCPPAPTFPLVVLLAAHNCLTCWLLFVSVDADCPRLAGVDPAPFSSTSPRQRIVVSAPHRLLLPPPRHATAIFQRRKSAAIPMLFDCCLLVPMLIVLASLGLNQRHRPIDAENSANTSAGTVQFQYWASIGAHTGIGTAAMAFISSMGTCQVPIPVLALP